MTTAEQRRFHLVLQPPPPDESPTSLRRSVSLNDDDDTLRMSCLDDAATASTSLSTTVSDTARSPQFRSTIVINPNPSPEPLDHALNDWSEDREEKQQHSEHLEICDRGSEEFRWLLMQGTEQRSFGSCTTMECNHRWQSREGAEEQNKSQKLFLSNATSPMLVKRVPDLDNSMMKARTTTTLVPLLLCVVLIFFLITTILLIMVIFLSTRTMKTATGSSGSLSPMPIWSSPFNASSLYAYKIRQDLHEQAEIRQRLMNSFNSANIKKNVRWLTEKVHVAGTNENAELARKIADEYRRYGYDVRTYSYNVLLNFPNYEKPNRIEVDLGGGDWKELSNGLAERLGPKEALEQEDPRSLVYWTAYSKNGTAIGPMVYVNYGTVDDYLRLEKYGISLQGKIALCRYGALYRGDKVQLAAERGAVGLILYSDPYDYTNGRNDVKSFPDEIWLPGSGAQRGTLLKTDGDPETPFLPSKYYVHRTETEENLRERQVMPSIPVTPIGYRDAQKIMQQLDGMKIKLNDWIGAMNVTYRINGSAFFRLTVHSACTHRVITNIVATMSGKDEPDRYVLFSNHYDAWVKGAVDPSSATGTMLEMARVLAKTRAITNWHPRRTIMFCQWDAEEFGLIGSTEWVEEFMKPLQQRAVAVINVDNINGNTSLSVKAVPLLYRTIVSAAAKIGSPSEIEQMAERKTLLDSWRYYDPKGPIPGDRSIPGISPPGSGSDFQRFITYLGIPVIDMKLESAPLYTYMLYHTMYEIPWMLENFVDENYLALVTLGQLWLELGRDIADSLIIPFDLHDYGLALADFISKMDQQLEHIGIPKAIGSRAYRLLLNNLFGALSRFQIVADVIQEITQSINTGHESVSIKQAEMLNNRLQNVERAFIAEQGIYPERAEFRHLIFSNTIHNEYGSSVFAGILDPALHWRSALVAGDLSKADYWLKLVKTGLSKLQYAIESATSILNMDGYYD